jgi:GNAT superfamily N-acetyltransferase
MRSEVTIRPVGEPGDLGWVVMTHGEVYFREFGWDTRFEELVAHIVADYAAGHDSNREAAWIVETQGRRAGCVFCVAKDEQTAQLRLLLVDPTVRGLGIGGQLVCRCVSFARDAGYSRMMLWTNDVLVAAARLYLAAGFCLVDQEPHHSFGVDLVGQIYELKLVASTRSEKGLAVPTENPAAGSRPDFGTQRSGVSRSLATKDRGPRPGP